MRFSFDDLQLFSAASHDRNPIHVSGEYARKSFYGDQVVFGMLGVLACLGHVSPPENCVLAKIHVEFPGAMFLGTEYKVTVTQRTDESFSARLYDGSKLLVKTEVAFCNGNPGEMEYSGAGRANRRAPADTDEIIEGATVTGEYLPSQPEFRQLLNRYGLDGRRFDPLQLSTLLCASYIVGMEQPGLRSLFAELSLSFDKSGFSNPAALVYQSTAASVSALNAIRASLSVSANERLLAKGHSLALIIPRAPVVSVDKVAELLHPAGRLKGKVALVIGASRGLGAALAAALCLEGCSVIANFHRSLSEAQELEKSVSHASGRLILAQGNAADISWCEALETRIIAEFGRLDLVIWNACPPPRPLRIEPSMVNRINSYVDQALSLVSVPLSLYMDELAKSSGCGVLVSSVVSSYAENSPKEWPHYVAAKSAVEGLFRVAALQYPGVKLIIARPPRLRTDMMNTPTSYGNAMLPEVAAARILERILSAAGAGVDLFSFE